MTDALSTASLSQRFDFQRIGQTLLPYEGWHPCPTAEDRPAWERTDPELRDLVLKNAEESRGQPWPALPATLYAAFERTGNRTDYQRLYYQRRKMLSDLVLAECLTGEGRYLDDVVDGVWAICEETGWNVPSHNFPPRWEYGRRREHALPDHRFPIVDLFAAETGSVLAWTQYLLGSALAQEFPRVPERIRDEVRRRLLVPYRAVDEWRWLRRYPDGRPPSNWNPWIHSNLLAATLILEDDPYTRVALVARMVRGIDAFLAGYGDDGGCDEGVSYFWQAGARLFECLELLASATGGELDAFDDPKLAAVGRYLHRMHVGGDWYVNFADGDARQSRGGELLYRFGKRVGDPAMQAHALFMRDSRRSVDVDTLGNLYRPLMALRDTAYADAPAAPPPLVRDTWLSDIEVLACRSAEGTTAGLFLAAKGGHNNESHNHNDVGSFIVGLDGVPVLIDVGVGVYTRQTFSGDRYGIWTMQSAYHNVPMVDGHQQQPGQQYRARDVTCEVGDDASWLRLDIADAYPAEAGVRRWTRTLRLERDGGPDGTVVLTDDYELDRRPGELALHLMAWPAPLFEPGRVVLPSGDRCLAAEYDPAVFRVRAERIAVVDERLASSWGEAVHRIAMEVIAPRPTGSWTVRIVAQATTGG